MKKYLALMMLLACAVSGCKKFLDAKPDKKLLLPDNIEAVQAMLDNDNTMNQFCPGTGEASADNYYVTDASWASLSSLAERNMYIWESDITFNEFPNHWSRLYDVVNITNIALEGLNTINITASDHNAWNNAKGSALLFRAKSFLTAACLWARAYDKNTAATDLGIPLRLNSNYQERSVRSSVQQTYSQIIQDLKEAARLLPVFPQHVMRPSRTAAYGLLARTYLIMNNFDSALFYADSYLAVSANLLNFNSLNAAASYPVPKFNMEVSMHSTMSGPTILNITNAKIDSVLYQSYATNDLRKTVFFKSTANGTYSFKGSYNQSSTYFNGIATDEMYLLKAECQARANNINDAMTTLNQLLIKRWKTGTFIPYVASDIQAALLLILSERRKELLFRDLRWSDLKRLNRELGLQQTIKRKLNAQIYSLAPNENRYVLPIPQSVISSSGIEQNPR